MISLICPLIYYLLFNGLLVFISKKSFGKCLPLSFMINAFIYFISQIVFHTFKIGFLINVFLALLFIGLVIWMKIKKKSVELNKLKDNYFTNGMIAFLVIFICVYIFDLNRTFSVWDEWSHWGVMIKEMFRLDKFYSINASTLMVHKDYPPITQLFELFYSQISGGYNETFLIRAIHLFSFSLFIPAISEKVKKISIIKTCINTLIIVMSVFLILLFFDQHGIINAIYIDYLMSIIIAYLMANIIFEENTTSNFNLVIYMVGFSFLLLMKQMGLPLFLMVLFMFIADIIIKNRKDIIKYLKNNFKLIIKITVMLIIIPLLFWKGWNSYTSTLNIHQQFNLSDLKILELKGIISGTAGEEWQIETSKNYIHALKTENITTSNIHLSYLQCFVLTLLLLYIVYIFGHKIIKKEQISLSSFTLSCGFLGYAFVMLVMYVFSFGPNEGPNLASYNRYMSTYVLIAMSFIYMLVIYLYTSNDKKEKINILIITACFLFLIQKPEIIESCFPKIRRSNPNMYEIHASNINKKVKKNSKIYVISQNTLGQYQYPIKYYSEVNKINLDNYNFKTDSNINNYKEYFDKNYKSSLSKYDYLYLAVIDDEFVNNYSFLFEDDNSIKETNIYRIEKNDNELILKKI